MKNSTKEEMYEFINEFKRIIQINKSKISKYFLDRDYFSELIDDLDKNLYNTSILHTKYVNFLNNFGKFINKYEIDNSQIKKPILDKIKAYCRLNGSPKEIVFSEDEDNTDEDSEDESNESIINSELNEPMINNESNEPMINNKSNESIINSELNESNESIIHDLLKKVGNVLEKSTINDNDKLIFSLKEQSKIKKLDNTNIDNTLIEQ